MGTDAAINAIADRFKEVTDSSARARMAEQLFSREGAALIPVLAKGSAGLDEAAAAAKRFGQLVTGEAAAKAMTAQRAMDDLGKSWEGLQRQAAISFAPVLAEGATALTDMLNSGDKGKAFFDSLAEGAMTFLVDVLKGMKDVYTLMKDIMGLVASAKAVWAIGSMAATLLTGAKGGGGAKDSTLDDINASIDKAEQMRKDLAQKLADLGRRKRLSSSQTPRRPLRSRSMTTPSPSPASWPWGRAIRSRRSVWPGRP